MGKISRFQLVNTRYNEFIARVEMDEDLLKPEVGILDPETLSLHQLKNGTDFTFVPLEGEDNHTVKALLLVQQAYENMKKPYDVPSFSLAMNRMDDLLGTVGMMFGEIKYTVIESKEDVEQLLRPTTEDKELKEVTRTILGDMLSDAIKAEQENQTDDQNEPTVTVTIGAESNAE